MTGWWIGMIDMDIACAHEEGYDHIQVDCDVADKEFLIVTCPKCGQQYKVVVKVELYEE